MPVLQPAPQPTLQVLLLAAEELVQAPVPHEVPQLPSCEIRLAPQPLGLAWMTGIAVLTPQPLVLQEVPNPPS